MVVTPSELDPYRLPTSVRPSRYDLRLRPSLGEATFSGSVRIDLSVDAPTETLVLNADELTISSCAVDGAAATWLLDPTTERLFITPAVAIEPGTSVLTIEFDGVLNDKLRGFYRSTYVDDDGTEQVIATTQMQATDCRRAFPCWDEPDFKAVFAVTLDVEDGLTAISNAPEIGRATDEGRCVIRFADTMVMSSYLVAFVVGKLEMTDVVDVDGVPLRLVHVPGKGHLTDFGLDIGAFSLRWFQDYYGIAYPGAKVDLVALPDFAAGAMENLGCITFRESLLLVDPAISTQNERQLVADVVAHELAHMWFGDLVTMRWWDDLWLNESFATFASVLCQADATEYSEAWTTFANVEKSWAYRQDQLPSTHPIAADIPDLHAVEVNFDGITYAKGASVLKQLVAYVGLEHFLAGLRDYFAAHAFDNATFDDLLFALERASGRDLSDWGRQWLKTTGLNTLRADFDVDADGKFARFAIVQGGATPGAGETRVHRLAVGVYDDRDDSGRLVRVHREEFDVVGPITEVPALQGIPRGKLVLINDDDLTYCSMRLDPESLTVATARIADIAEPLPRTLVWSAAWEMTRDAELKARDFVALVTRGVEAETEVGVAQRLLMQAQSALNSFADPGWAVSEGWPAFTDRLLGMARGAEPGSDHQLAYVNALCSSVLSERHLAVLADLLDRDPADCELTGLQVDTDLRWRIVTALAAGGRIDADATQSPFIDAEVERDPTAAGRRHGAAASAARPQPDVKHRAWREVIEDDTLPNATARAIITGWAQPGQSALLTPFAEQYFHAINSVWERRSSEVAQTVVIGLYPSWDVSAAGLAAADRFLSGELPPALRRLVLEGRAGVERALAARVLDAG